MILKIIAGIIYYIILYTVTYLFLSELIRSLLLGISDSAKHIINQSISGRFWSVYAPEILTKTGERKGGKKQIAFCPN